ncbi:MAG TPA: lanthionine synthetase LanC family protein [Thermoanaerobaculia bacterium]|nr:lanthionine synthetase LanC family protein [Thermoanaerobaculia bacterium]
MNISEAFVLRRDVVLVPVTALAAEVRAKIEYDEGDYALSRLHGRMTSQIIDGETASLLELFREPTTIASAVIRNGLALSKDPRHWLEELLPHLGKFIQNKVLVPAGEKEDVEAKQLVASGARVGDWDVLHTVNVMEDSEIHRVRRDGVDGALKISRGGADALIANEAEVLRWLDGTVAPKLFDSGEHEGRPWLVVEWCDGADAGTAAKYGAHDRGAVLALCTAIANAYVELHERQVIHADVHPRNLMIAADRGVRVIDFGLSRIDGVSRRLMPRGGMYYFFEPEYLAAGQRGQELAASYAGEQYALAALLYALIAGQHYLDFRYEREEMMRQTQFDPPLPFTARGIPPWPEVEAILVRALEKDPSRRFPSMRAFAEALAAVRVEDETLLSDEARAFAERELSSLDYPLAPRASVNYGATGAALGLLRVACVRSDPRLLAKAEVWRSRAAQFIGVDEGWYEEQEAPLSMIGTVSPFHTRAGLHAAAAMIAYARADPSAQRMATQAFLDASSGAVESSDLSSDLTLGRAGTLLACSLLLPLGSDVAALGRATLAELESQPWPSTTYLGVAHGWSGQLYATLRWCLASGDAPPAELRERLSALASFRVRRGRGAWWPRLTDTGARDMMPGWCNGAAGHVFTYTAAYDLLRDDEFLRIAEEAAWNAWEEPLNHADLCCGSAGRAYALLNLYKHTGDRAWVSRARHLANHAITAPAPREHALWKGTLGVAVLIADLESPETAQMPLFE